MNEDTYQPTKFLPKMMSTKRFFGNRSGSVGPGFDFNAIDIERMRKDVDDKDKYIATLQIKADIFKEISKLFRLLIIDLEESTGLSLLSESQKANFDHLPHNESIRIIKSSMNQIIGIHKSLSGFYESKFADALAQNKEDMDKVEQELILISKKKGEYLKEMIPLTRITMIHQKEKETLSNIADSLKSQIEMIDSDFHQKEYQAKEQIHKVDNEIEKCRSNTDLLSKKNEKLLGSINEPIHQTHVDMLKLNDKLKQDIARISLQLTREKQEHRLTIEELDHTKHEIEIAKDTVKKYKSCMNRKEMEKAEKTNYDLRTYIAMTREESKDKLSEQIKRNRDLERQINELEEEESMLKPYLVTIEKKLHSQMHKLPLMSGQQDDDENNSIQIRPKTRISKKEMEDQEMRNIKRAMSRIKTKQYRPKTSFI